MHDFLKGLRVVEGSAFVAAPLCGLTLVQMGAEVIRFDTIGGGPDYRRWPQVPGGAASLYWEGLNKGKKSIAINLACEAGWELAQSLATAPGPQAGLFVTNYPVDGFLSHARLAPRRPDLISVRVMGWNDGRTAVDYTVNAALGYPMMTGGPELGDVPVNHVLPAWDVATGLYAAMALVGAERRRSRTGEGAELRVPLGDVARATMANLGHVAEVSLTGADRPRIGNDVFGALGRDFVTRDARRLMVVALTRRQWRDLVGALGLKEPVAALEAELGCDFGSDEGLRFQHRDRLNPLISDALSSLTFAEWEARVRDTGVCWGPYNTLAQALSDPQLFREGDGLFAAVTHASGERYLTPASPVSRVGAGQTSIPAAPRLGAHTDEVLASVLGMSERQIGRLHEAGVVAGPQTSGVAAHERRYAVSAR